MKVPENSYSKPNYNDYMQSPEWKKKKESIKRVCYICGSEKNINVHHRSYSRLGHETERDLIALCQECHSDVHGFIMREYPRRLWATILWSAASMLKKRREKLVRQFPTPAINAASAPKFITRKKVKHES